MLFPRWIYVVYILAKQTKSHMHEIIVKLNHANHKTMNANFVPREWVSLLLFM